MTSLAAPPAALLSPERPRSRAGSGPRLAPRPARGGVAIVVPTLNEAAHIERVIGELAQGIPDGIEACIVVVDGGSTDRTPAIVAALAARDRRIALMHNPQRIQSAALNLAAQAVSPWADWLIRADAHAHYPPDFVAQVLTTLDATEADSVVVPMDSQGHGCMARAVAWVSDTLVGSGGAAHRGGNHAGWIDHGHHAGWVLASFLAAGGYDESYTHNEDSEFDCRLRGLGGRIWMEPAIRLTYMVRPTLGGLWRQYRRYGTGRSRTMRRHPSSIRARQLLVPAGVGAVCAGALLAPVVDPLLAIVPLIYLAVLAAVSLRLAVRHRSVCGLAGGLAAMVMHFGWAAGFVGGLLTFRERPWLPADKEQAA